MQVLLIESPSTTVPDAWKEWFLDWEFQITSVPSLEEGVAQARTGDFEVLVIAMDQAESATPQAQWNNLFQAAETGRIAMLVASQGSSEGLIGEASLIDVMLPSVSQSELHARLNILLRCQSSLQRMDREIANMERIGKRLNRHFSEVDQEMQLAGRLQRDFLPDFTGPFGQFRFSTVFRPVTWVSGDIYDIFRVDERHIAFYVADAVGHGMAASLLTMFIKKAIVAKRVFEGGYDLLSPSETLRGLNDALASQSLPNCQFVTACYCLINIETLELQYARGGHPYPLLVSTEGAITELRSTGGLLGVFPGEDFDAGSVQLQPGEKVILYSDGLEVAYDDTEDDKGEKWLRHQRMFQQLAGLPAEELASKITMILDDQEGSLSPTDDVTVVALEVLPKTSPVSTPTASLQPMETEPCS